MMNIYVGNLSYSVTSEDLEAAFGAHGTVERAQVVSDRETGRSRGFGFVEMPDDNEARAAMEALNGSELGERSIVVNEARPRR
ncbi:MAG TPA: RNA-binding protein [Phycisphaerae bacterium]|nr:RNA-binding protein [Phycisphaerae bacterium]